MFSTKLSTSVAFACALSLAVIPVVRSAEIAVTVGGAAGLKFEPESVTANVGDIVTFTFQQRNHTVTQSTLENPCTPLDGGFDSGFVPIDESVTSGFPVAELTIENTDAIWVYCRQGNHCQQGMVFAINAGDNFDQFKSAATGSGAEAPTTTAPATETPSETPSVVTVTATVTVSDGQEVTTTYGSYPGSASPTTGTTTDHKVVVGGEAGLVYEPSNITAQAGDTVTFEFRQKNHTVTMSSFDEPCRALSLTSTTGEIGFDSGFMPVSPGVTNFPTYTLQINDTKPIWAYCRQGNHCGMGMVFSINAVETGDRNFAAFQAKAKEINGTAPAASDSDDSNDNGASASKGSVFGAGIVIAVAAAVVGSVL